MTTLNFNTSSNSIVDSSISITSHNLITGVNVRYQNGSDPSPYNIGLTDGTEYYVVVKNTNAIYLTSNLDDIQFFLRIPFISMNTIFLLVIELYILLMRELILVD
jgi:hypothetical protein